VLKPIDYQGGFTEASRRTNQDQRVVNIVVESLHQPPTGDQVFRQARPVQLSLQEDLIVIRHTRL